MIFNAKLRDGVVAMGVLLGGIAVVLGVAGMVAFSPWLVSVIVLGIGIEAAGIISRHRRERARRYGSEVAALRGIHAIRLLGNEYRGHHHAA